MANDDKLIDDLLDKTEKLKNVTEDITNFFNSTRTNVTDEDDNFEETFLTDMCSSIAITVEEAMDVMYARACRIEDYVSELPTLNQFDSLIVELCGFYCLEYSCSYGFPSLILNEYIICLMDEDRRDKAGDTSSNEYIQVSGSGNLSVATYAA